MHVNIEMISKFPLSYNVLTICYEDIPSLVSLIKFARLILQIQLFLRTFNIVII